MVVTILVASLLPVFSILTFAAEDMIDIPKEEWDNFDASIPDDVRDKLSDGADDGMEGFLSGVEEMSKGEYVAGVIFDIVGIELGGAVKFFFGLCAIVLIASIFSALGEGSNNAAMSVAARYCSVGGIISLVIYVQYSHFELLEELFEKLGAVVSGIIPITACIWAMGGNVGTASVGSASFSIMLSVSEAIFSYTLLPVSCVLTVLGFCDALSSEIKMGKILSAIKKIYGFILGMVMTVLLSSMAAQTALAASADSTAARAARLVSGTVIPILGGSVGETFRTVAAGVSYLKNAFGIGSIIIIALLVLPAIIDILLTRFAFLIGAGLADMLGCSSEARVLENLGEVYGMMLAVVSGVAVTFVMGLCVFIRSVVAVA